MCRVKVTAEPLDWRVVVRLDNDAEEASYVYDLVKSGRLQVEDPDSLPLPFRGHFLFKLPGHPRPIEIRALRVEPTAAEIVAGDAGPRLVIAIPKSHPELLAALEAALRDVPPASAEEFMSAAEEREDEFARVRKMPFAKKVIYATRAGQTGRTVLLQQPTPLLLLYLCKNPRITLTEVIQIAKMPSIDALVADYVGKLLKANPQWALSEELKLALVSNVKTPVGAALALMTHMSNRSLSSLGKVPELRNVLKQAAVRLLQDR
jgi:hypothetical protein